MPSNDKRIFAGLMLSGSLIDRGLDASHADQFHALLRMSAKTFLNFASTVPDWEETEMIDLIHEIIVSDDGTLRAFSTAERWFRRKSAYEHDRASWEAAEDGVGESWRAKSMTAGQRFLVQSTAALLEIEIPAGMNRGGAADWLAANTAHIVLMFNENYEEQFA